MVKCGVFFEVRTEFLNIISIVFGLPSEETLYNDSQCNSQAYGTAIKIEIP
jgi:hypothetical protein